MSAHPTTVTDAAATRQLVVFALAGELYGIAIARVQEIIHHAPARPMPGSAPEVEGVINLRGRLIPVIDLRVRLGLVGAIPEGAKVVVTELGDGAVGLVVDDVREVATVPLDATEPPPQGVLAGAHGAIEAVARLGDRIVVILDPVRLLEPSGT